MTKSNWHVLLIIVLIVWATFCATYSILLEESSSNQFFQRFPFKLLLQISSLSSFIGCIYVAIAKNRNFDMLLSVGGLVFIFSIFTLFSYGLFLPNIISFDPDSHQFVTSPYTITSAAQMFVTFMLIPFSYFVIFSAWLIKKFGVVPKLEQIIDASLLQKIKSCVFTNQVSRVESLLNYPLTMRKGFWKFFILCLFIDCSVYYLALLFTIEEMAHMVLFPIKEIIFPWKITNDEYLVNSPFFVHIFTVAGPLIVSILHQNFFTKNNMKLKRKTAKILLSYFYSTMVLVVVNLILLAYFIPSVFAPEFFFIMNYRWFEFLVVMLLTFGLITALFVFMLESKLISKLSK